jgi:two-component system sensor histidine kinase ArlS
MRIRTRLTLIYTVIIALILLFLNLYIFYFTKISIKKDFFDRLENRALVIAQMYLKEDNLPPEVFEQVRTKFVQSIPEEIPRMYDSLNRPSFIVTKDDHAFSTEIINKARSLKNIEYEDKERQVVGIFTTDNQGDFVTLVSAPDISGHARLNELKKVLLIGFFISILIVYISGLFFSKQALKPMSDIIVEVKKISASNLHLRVNEGNGKDEIALLAVTFNEFLNRLEIAFEMQKNFVSNASHELRTPLTSIIGEVEVTLNKHRNVDYYEKTLKSVLIEGEKLNQLTTGLLNLARVSFDDSQLIIEDVRIDELLWETKEMLLSQNKDFNIHIEYLDMPEDPDKLIIRGNKQLIQVALGNILENACKFSDNKTVEAILKFNPQKIQISISDKGIGIPVNDLKNIFEPFYRAINARPYSGSGVGLSLTQKIIKLHKGSIELSSILNEGTKVEIEFPHG